MPEEKTPDQTPRNPGENPGQSLRAVNSPSEGAEDKFPPRFLGKIRQKAHSVLDALLMDMLECAQGGENDDQSERTERDAGGHRRGHRRGAGDHHREGPHRREGPHLHDGLRGAQKAHAPMREEPGTLEGDRLRDEWGGSPRPPTSRPPPASSDTGAGRRPPSRRSRGRRGPSAFGNAPRRERRAKGKGNDRGRPGTGIPGFFHAGRGARRAYLAILAPRHNETLVVFDASGIAWGIPPPSSSPTKILDDLLWFSDALPPQTLRTRLKAPLGAILPSDGNFPILPPSRRPAAPSWPSRGHPRLPPSGCAARATRAQPSRLPSPPCLPPPRGGKGQRKMEGVHAPTPRMRGTRRARGGPSESPLPPLPMPRKPRAHAPAHYAPSRTRGARSKCFAYTRERKRRNI